MRPRTIGLISILVLGLLAAPLPADAQEAIVLVRHTEQAGSGPFPGTVDPPLTETGKQRAKALATVLRDAGINAIYGSEFRRTVQTAEPLAKDLNIEIKVHPRGDNEGLVRRLRTQHASDRVLIVSHHGRISALIEALGYPAWSKVGSLEYDNLFVIVPKTNGAPLVLRLHY